jgi:molecular chaperone DnaK (HSP70)
MKMRQVNFSISHDMNALIEAKSKELKLSKSELIEKALLNFFGTSKEFETYKKLEEGLAELDGKLTQSLSAYERKNDSVLQKYAALSGKIDAINSALNYKNIASNIIEAIKEI